jgi:GR25 family glycosyltransferase involved in LPS biosynthesis
MDWSKGIRMRVEALIISMRDQPAREAQVRAIRETCPVPSSVVAAVDGRALGKAQLTRAFRAVRHRPAYPFPPRPGEIGCFLSHRAAWQAIIDRRLDAALILEDDVELRRPRFDPAFALACEAVRTHGLVRLPLMERAGAVARARSAPTVSRPIVLPLGTQAQVVSADAARRLLEVSEPFDRPIDVFLQMRWVTGVPSCVVSPSGVHDATSRVGGSTIQARGKPFVEVLSHEIRRPLYRAAIRALGVRAWITGEPRGGA